MKKVALLLALCFSICSFAQITIKGTVMNDSIPLEFANVIIKNSKKGTATNIKGQFKLKAKKGDTLSISYLGYEPREIVVYKDEIFEIKLEEGGSLKEVVLNGFLDGRKTICSTIACYTHTRCGLSSQKVEKRYEPNLIELKLYPNPSSNGVFQLKLIEDYNEIKISIANISGHIIQNTKHQNFGKKLTIDLSEFSTGIYIVSIIADGSVFNAIKAIRS